MAYFSLGSGGKSHYLRAKTELLWGALAGATKEKRNHVSLMNTGRAAAVLVVSLIKDVMERSQTSSILDYAFP